MTEDRMLLEALLRFMRDLRQQFDQSAQEVGLTFARARVVSTLARMEGATQTELAAALDVEPPTLKRQLDALEKDDFVTRRDIDGDRRKRGLFVTERAQAAHTTHFLENVSDDLLRGITGAEKQLMRDILSRLSANISGLTRP